MMVKKSELLQWCDSMKYCLQHGQLEDAYQWCLDLLRELYSAEIAKRTRLEDAVERVKKGDEE